MDQLITNDVYRFLFENSFDAILLTHPNGTVYRANPVACEMFQRTEEEICRLGRCGVIDVDDPRLELALREREINGKVRTELNFKRRDGSVFPTECTSTIFKDGESKTWTVIIVRDMSLLKTAEELMRKAQEESAYFATYDYLTGTLNRRAFMNRFEQELQRAKRENTPLSLILLDVDFFKQINDTQGHVCGDEILKEIVKCLSEKLRPYDIFGRYGGDEFIVCLPNTTGAEANEVAERLRIHIKESEMTFDGEIVPTSISIGLACHNVDSDEDSNSLIVRADKNLYTAKQQRNSVCRT